MAKEIERKFLVKSDEYKNNSKKTLYKQGYIPSLHGISVRVRIINDKALITIKGKINATTRNEYEYEIPYEDGIEMLSTVCKNGQIEKYRYEYLYKGKLWEIDEFLGDNSGLVVAEIELESENEFFEKPDFVGEEVTLDMRYANSNLVVNPFMKWQC